MSEFDLKAYKLETEAEIEMFKKEIVDLENKIVDYQKIVNGINAGAYANV